MTYEALWAHQAQLIAAARQGETSGLIEHLYIDFLPARAHKLAHMFRDCSSSAPDVEDIIQVGALALVGCLETALSKGSNPVGYLMQTAQVRMLDFCKEQGSPIRVPAGSQRSGKRGPMVLSLDAALRGCEDLTLLDVIAAGS